MGSLIQDLSAQNLFQHLTEQDNNFSRILETVADAVILLDAERRVTYLNPATEQLFGVSQEQVAQQDNRVMPLITLFNVDGEDIGPDESPFVLVRDSLKPVFDADYGVLRQDGSRLIVSANISPLLDADGRFAGVVCSFRDITRRFQLERELRRSNAELEQFAYVASHDLQEPLRMVSSYVQLLARRYKGQLDDDAGEFIGYAVDGAQRMQRLINDLLAFSRIDTQGRAFVDTDLNIVMQRTLSTLKSTIEDSGAQVTIQSLPRLPADDGQIEQLFRNLIANAIKYRRPGVSPQIDVRCQDYGDTWLFSVSDNGIGIAEDHHQRVFLIFQRLHTREEYVGTGIGLSICRRIVERHGGEIWIESDGTHGSTFHFTLLKGELFIQ